MTTLNTEDLYELVKRYEIDLSDHNQNVLILKLKTFDPKNKCTFRKTRKCRGSSNDM